MKTLERALLAETRKQQWHRYKLYTDVWVQAALVAFTLVALFTGEGFYAFSAFYVVLGFYQVLSSLLHRGQTGFARHRAQYNKWMELHLVAFVPCAFLLFPLFLFMVTSAALALYYIYITLKEFNEYCK